MPTPNIRLDRIDAEPRRDPAWCEFTFSLSAQPSSRWRRIFERERYRRHHWSGGLVRNVTIFRNGLRLTCPRAELPACKEALASILRATDGRCRAELDERDSAAQVEGAEGARPARAVA